MFQGHRRFLAVVAVVALFGAACGDSGSSIDALDDATAATSDLGGGDASRQHDEEGRQKDCELSLHFYPR